MNRTKKFAMVVLVAMLAIVAIAGTAQALRSIEVSPGGRVRAEARALVFNSSGGRVTCRVDLEAELERAIPKTAGALIARVIAASIPLASCSSERGGVQPSVLTLPWHIRYESFEGRLPEDIRVINAIVLAVRFNLHFLSLGIDCLYGGDLRVKIEATRNVARRIRVVAGQNLPRLSGSIFCPPEGELSGEFSLSPEQRLRLL
jgi:hypothetical protein